jgi:hypothetical protein
LLPAQVRNSVHCTDLESDGASEVEYYLTLLEDNEIAAQDGGVITKAAASSKPAASASGAVMTIGGDATYTKTSPAAPARSNRVGPIA